MSAEQPQPFPIDSILLKTYRALFQNFGYALRITWAWILVVTSARIGADLIKAAALTTETGESIVPWDLTFVIGWLTFIPLASIAVAWHRLLLTGEKDRSAVYLRLDRLVWTYFGLASVVYIIAMFPILAPWALGSIVKLAMAISGGNVESKSAVEVLFAPLGPAALPFIQTAAVILFLALTARFAVVLPGKALGTPGISLRQTWQVTRGQTWNLLIGTMCCIIPFLLVTAYIRRLGFEFTAADGPLLHVADWLMIESVAALLSLLQIAFLSYCFQFFFPDKGDGAAAA